MKIDSLSALYDLYDLPTEKTIKKELATLDQHSRRFIQFSPFVLVSTRGADGSLDASPRGGEPGFVKVLDDDTLLIPDAKGNNRLDSLRNIVETEGIGLLFMIPGVDETLRLNGSAGIMRAESHLELFAEEKKPPISLIEVKVEKMFIHCTKAFTSSRLWDPESQLDRSYLASMAEMVQDHVDITTEREKAGELVAQY